VNRSSEWLSKSIYLLAAGLYFLTVVLRTWLFFQGSPVLGKALALLLIWALLFASEWVVSNRWPSYGRAYFPLYLVCQTALTFILMALPSSPDFMGALLAVLSMQAMLHLPTWIGAAWIAACAVLMFLLLRAESGNEAFALALIYTAGNVFFGSYILTLRRTQAAQQRNHALAGDLAQANQRLQAYAAQVEQLAAARERNHLARELHDSVTQTVFSMNLTAQSASLLLARDSSRVAEQLDRLYDLARSALAEIQVLIDRLKPEVASPAGLLPALQRLLADRRFADLSVSINREGEETLSAAEEQSLYRITQEALNNILKHTRESQARIQLHLEEPCWLEIEDHGQGFDVPQAQRSGRVGLASMSERAQEIGWKLQIISTPGTGTRIRVDKGFSAENPRTTGRCV
jgi:signal transduction histidine kinase